MNDATPPHALSRRLLGVSVFRSSALASPWRRISTPNRHLSPVRSIKFAISTAANPERSKTTGGSLTFGPAPAASLGLGNTRIDSKLASVTEQSALRAGDGGFAVDVLGTTELVGGAITSTDKAVQDGRNSFASAALTLSDIDNRASYKASSVGVSVGAGASKGASAGVGSDKGSASSTTQAAISGIAGDTAARTGDSQTGIAPIFDADKVQKDISAQVQITQEFGKQASQAVGDYAEKQLKEAQKTGDQAGIDAWKEGGTNRVALHALVGGLTGGVAGALGSGAASAAAPAIEQLQGQLKTALKDAGLGEAAAQAIASLSAGAAAATIGAAASGGSVAGAATAFNADMNNRQLHPSEAQWIKDKARDFAKKEGISENEATERLTQQALKDVDYVWRAQLSDGDDAKAQAFLRASQQTFTNDLGEAQKLFTASGQQLFRPEMFADTANPAFYKQFSQSGITRSLTSGLLKEASDSGLDIKNGAIDLAKTIQDNPALAVNAVWNAVKGLPQGVVDSFKETGIAIGEGAAVALNRDLTDKLNAIYGTDVSGAQQALLAIRIVSATTGTAGTAKGAAGLSEAAAKAVGKKLDTVLDEKVLQTLLQSGGAVDKTGQAVLDLKSLSTAQKGVMGELFGQNTVSQIVPDGQKIARMPGVGETGLDDLYKVNRTDVDYVVIEYKFVGTDSKTGAQVLKNTNDGLQGSQSWIGGSGRIEKAVGTDHAIDVDKAFREGRTETWVVTTRPDGATEIQVLDAFGKPKPVDKSKIILPKTNLSGAQP